MNWIDMLTFPISIEGADQEAGPWVEIVSIEERAFFEYKLNAFKYPVYPFMRFREASGAVHEVPREQLLDFNEATLEKTERDTEALKQFLRSAPEQALDTARELVMAGLAAKRFAILPNSQVVLGHSALHAIHVYEFDDSVCCKVLTADREVDETEPVVTLWKEVRPGVNMAFSFCPEGLDVSIVAFLCLLCSSIVRDFWVMEERASARTYQRRTEKHRARVGTGAERKLVTEKRRIYIPRVSYALDADRSETEVSHGVRVQLSPHLVSGHLRRLTEGRKASAEALERAGEYGIHVGEGQTFVRPYRKGEVEQMRTYRSRSAFELLFKT